VNRDLENEPVARLHEIGGESDPRVRWQRQCLGCGKTFLTANLNQKRCRSGCGGRGESSGGARGGSGTARLQRSPARAETWHGETRLPFAAGVAAGYEGRVADAAVTQESLIAALQSGRATPVAVATAMARAKPIGTHHGVGPPSPRVATAEHFEFASWGDWLGRVSAADKRERCRQIAHGANRHRLLSGAPLVRLTPREVWAVLVTARGRCAYCDSLAVERRPSGPGGEPVAWSQIGRRIGSLGHRVARFHGGDNDRENLIWSCLWCNTWQSERRRGARNHGGLYPSGDDDVAISDPWTGAPDDV
jgi:hypothetical protein